MSGELITGTVGADITPEDANVAAEWVGLNIISTLKAELGDLDRVAQVVKLVAFVACTDDFTAQPGVVNGCSDLLGKVFRDRGVSEWQPNQQ